MQCCSVNVTPSYGDSRTITVQVQLSEWASREYWWLILAPDGVRLSKHTDDVNLRPTALSMSWDAFIERLTESP